MKFPKTSHVVPLVTHFVTALVVMGGLLYAAQPLSTQALASSPKDLPLDSGLWRLERDVREGLQPVTDLYDSYRRRSFVFDEQGRVHVELAHTGAQDPSLGAFLARFGARLDRQIDGRADLWVPTERLTELARALSPGSFLEVCPLPNYDDVVGEGPAVVHTAGYSAGGADGSGIRIGIIDGGFANLTSARSNGDVPSAFNTVQINYTPSFFEAGTTHGTGCVEAAFDHAPGAQYVLYRIDSATDIAFAVAHAINIGVDIISMSISYYNLGWDDDTGAASAAALSAASSGVLFFTSAGNRAKQHHKGVFVDADGDGWGEFSGTADESINILVPQGGDVRMFLSWDPAAGVADYDLFLVDHVNGQTLATSTNGLGVYESFSWDNPSPFERSVRVSVRRVSGAAATFEIFDHDGGNWLEHITAASSTTSPSNTTHPSVISVAAVHHTNYDAANGANVAESYSSRGPSNGGDIKPDAAAPTGTVGWTYSSGFGGTSCATPNAAGAAAAFWSSNLALSATSIRKLLLAQADAYHDWGSSGNDTVFGHGGIRVVDYAWGTRWIDRNRLNTTEVSAKPYYTLQAGHDNVPNGGRLCIIGGANYPESAFLDRAVFLDAIGGTKNFGM